MVSIAQIATYISYLFVIIAYTVKVVKVARMPMHLRWELYPVPHEIGHKYGGSYYEELDWWTHPRRTNRVRDIFSKLRDYFRDSHPEILKSIMDSGAMDAETEKKLKEAIAFFKSVNQAEA